MNIPQSFRDKEFARECALKSAEARREKRGTLPTVRELFGDHVEEVAARLIDLAKAGDRQACEFILTVTHGKPRQSLDATVEARREPDASVFEKYARMLKEAEENTPDDAQLIAALRGDALPLPSGRQGQRKQGRIVA